MTAGTLLSQLTDQQLTTFIAQIKREHLDALASRMLDPLLSQLTDQHLNTFIARFKREHLDVFSHRLHDPLQRLLRADLRSSRERSSRLRDGWR